MNRHYSLKDIVSNLGGELVGNNEMITGVGSLTNALPGQLSFLADLKYHSLLDSTKASAIVLRDENRNLTSLARIVTDNPYAYFARVSELLNPPSKNATGINSSASVDATSTIPESCTISKSCPRVRGLHGIRADSVRLDASATQACTLRLRAGRLLETDAG